jgi:hypothetical protein
MHLLILDVPNRCRHQRPAHAKRSIPLLPRKLETFVVRPPRRIRFDGVNCFRHRQSWWNLDQEMNVILHPANRMNLNSELSADSRHIRPHPRLPFLRNRFAPFLRAEDNMNHILRVCVGDVSHLRRYASLHHIPSAYALGYPLPRLRRSPFPSSSQESDPFISASGASETSPARLP